MVRKLKKVKAKKINPLCEKCRYQEKYHKTKDRCSGFNCFEEIRTIDKLYFKIRRAIERWV